MLIEICIMFKKKKHMEHIWMEGYGFLTMYINTIVCNFILQFINLLYFDWFQVPFKDEFPLALHNKILKDPVKFPSR